MKQAKADGLETLGQFIYCDAIVMHGPGEDSVSFSGIRRTAMARATTPARGGDETAYLNAFLDARKAAMLTEEAHSDTSRVDTEQHTFLAAGNLDLELPPHWTVIAGTGLGERPIRQIEGSQILVVHDLPQAAGVAVGLAHLPGVTRHLGRRPVLAPIG